MEQNRIKSIDSFVVRRKKKMIHKSDGIKVVKKVSIRKQNISNKRLENKRNVRSIDGVLLRHENKYTEKFNVESSVQSDNSQDFKKEKSPLFGVWKLSMIGAMIFGMIVMSLVYRNLGQTVEASDKNVTTSEEKNTQKSELAKISKEQQDDIKREENNNNRSLEEKAKENTQKDKEGSDIEKKNTTKKNATQDVNKDNVKFETDAITKKDNQIKKDYKKTQNSKKENVQYNEMLPPNDKKSKEQLDFEKRAKEMVAGYPIEKMLPYIFKQDREVASYLIAIAKQESGWGKRKPVLNGNDCYNYWGYRGKRKKMGSGGHSCFDSREEAVKVVGKRIHELVYDYNKTTVEKMIVWKCGKSCEGHSKEGVNRWIKTIKTYKNSLLGV